MSVVLCAYCKKHRWCLQCKAGVVEAVDSCPTCNVPLEPAPEVRAPSKEPLHEPCAGVRGLLGSYQLLLGQVANHAVSAFQEALEQVTKRNFTGYLDARVSSDKGNGKVIQSRVVFKLCSPKDKPHPGWSRLWVSPDVVALMRASTAAAQPESTQEPA